MGHEATVDDLYRVCGKAELVNGELVAVAPGGGTHGYASGEIFASLRDHARRTRRGVALADNVGFIVRLTHRGSFSPDAAYWVGEPLTEKFLEGAPAFAAEIRSPNDYGRTAERVFADKRADYFAAGTLVVWDVDLRRQTVSVYRCASPAAPTMYVRGEQAEAEPAVPGWSMPVSDLFPPE